MINQPRTENGTTINQPLVYRQWHADFRPWVFLPSVCTLLVAIMLFVSILYLFQHHATWTLHHILSPQMDTLVYGESSDGMPKPFSFFNGKLIISGMNQSASSIEVWDLSTGNLDHRIVVEAPTPESYTPAMRVISINHRPFLARLVGSSLDIEDPVKGDIQHLKWPGADWFGGWNISGDGRTLVGNINANDGNYPSWYAWKLDQFTSAGSPQVFKLDAAKYHHPPPFFSNDPNLLIVNGPDYDRVQVWDVAGRRKLYDGSGQDAFTFENGEHFVIVHTPVVSAEWGRTPSPNIASVHRVQDGREVFKVTGAATALHHSGKWLGSLSGDRIIFAAERDGLRGRCYRVEVWNGKTGALICQRDLDSIGGRAAMVTSNRLAIGDRNDGRWGVGGIYDVDGLDLLWPFSQDYWPLSFGVNGGESFLVRATENTPVSVEILNKTARESRWGVVGMPQCWIVGGLLVLFTLCMSRDARKAAIADSSWILSLAIVLLTLAALAWAFVAIIDASLGSKLEIAGPLLLVIAIFAGTRGRGWCLIAGLALLGVATWAGYTLNREGMPNLMSSAAGYRSLLLFDRHWWISSVIFSRALTSIMFASVCGATVFARSGWTR